MNAIDVFVEMGQKRTFAGGVDWPGWCRSGRDERTALQALVDYGPRYAQVLRSQEIEFQVPAGISDLRVTERHAGNATTDFGAPAVVLDADREPLDRMEAGRLQAILQAGWQAFDDAVERAAGRELQKGPRGGGRELAAISAHVVEAENAYLERIGWRNRKDWEKRPLETSAQFRASILKAFAAAVNGELPAQGPRGGSLWPPRYFMRRVAWHLLDHAWEIEDRSVGPEDHAQRTRDA